MFNAQVEQAARDHALECWPQESCGVVIDGRYRTRKNVAADPERTFQIARYPRTGLQAVVHSHPLNRTAPSAADMRGQLDTAVPWGIVATDGAYTQDDIVWFGDACPVPALVGRTFLHGVRDCYELVRHYYRLRFDVRLRPVPREPEWWLDGETDLLNTAAFQAEGFSSIPMDTLATGDVLICQIGMGVCNHCAIYEGGGLIVHHLSERLSRREPLGPWRRFVRHSLRHASRT